MAGYGWRGRGALLQAATDEVLCPLRQGLLTHARTHTHTHTHAPSCLLVSLVRAAPADKISHYLPNKTTRDCVQYYYRNKKSNAFKDAYRKLELKHRRSPLLAHASVPLHRTRALLLLHMIPSFSSLLVLTWLRPAGRIILRGMRKF